MPTYCLVWTRTWASCFHQTSHSLGLENSEVEVEEISRKVIKSRALSLLPGCGSTLPVTWILSKEAGNSETKNNKFCDETAALKYWYWVLILYNVCVLSLISLPYSVHCQLHCTKEVGRNMNKHWNRLQLQSYIKDSQQYFLLLSLSKIYRSWTIHFKVYTIHDMWFLIK